jgi:hypothetical protein
MSTGCWRLTESFRKCFKSFWQHEHLPAAPRPGLRPARSHAHKLSSPRTHHAHLHTNTLASHTHNRTIVSRGETNAVNHTRHHPTPATKILAAVRPDRSHSRLHHPKLRPPLSTRLSFALLAGPRTGPRGAPDNEKISWLRGPAAMKVKGYVHVTP